MTKFDKYTEGSVKKIKPLTIVEPFWWIRVATIPFALYGVTHVVAAAPYLLDTQQAIVLFVRGVIFLLFTTLAVLSTRRLKGFLRSPVKGRFRDKVARYIDENRDALLVRGVDRSIESIEQYKDYLLFKSEVQWAIKRERLDVTGKGGMV